MPDGYKSQIDEIDSILEELHPVKKGKLKKPPEEVSPLEKKLSEGKTVYLTSEYAEEMGIEDFIDPDWMVKITPDKEGYKYSYINLGEAVGYNPPREYGEDEIFVNGEGRWVTNIPEEEPDELQGLLEKLMPDFFAPFTPEQKTGIATQFLEKLQTDENAQDLFFANVQKQGRTPDTERLLKTLMPEITEEDIKGLFGEEQAPPVPITITEEDMELLRDRLHTKEGMPLQDLLDKLGMTPEEWGMGDVHWSAEQNEAIKAMRKEGERITDYRTPSGEAYVHVEGEALGPYEKFSQKVITTVNAPLFTIGGVGVSATDIANLGLLAYGGYQVLSQGIPKAYQQLVNTAVTRNVDKLSKETGVILDKTTKGNFIQALTQKLVQTQKPTWLTKQSIKEIFKPSGKAGLFKTTPQAETMAEDSFSPLVRQTYEQLSKLTMTQTGVPGMTMTQADILKAIQGITPATAEAVAAGRMELAKEPWQMTREEFINNAKAKLTHKPTEQFETTATVSHKKQILQALSEGKPVPPEVLKDYPDLVKPTVAPVAGVTPPETSALIPKTEPGQPEAGLQPSMMPEVTAKEVHPPGKGKVTQISMEDQLKLQQAREATKPPEEVKEPSKAEAQAIKYDQAKAELEGLQETSDVEGAEGLTYLLKQGEIEYLTKEQYVKALGRQPKPGILKTYTKTVVIKAHTTKSGRYVPEKSFEKKIEGVPWEYALDQLASERGYATGDELKEAIEKAGGTLQRINQLKAEISDIEANLKPSPKTPTIRETELTLPVQSIELTPKQTDRLLKLFQAVLKAPGTLEQRAATIELRKHVLAERASNASAKAEQLFIETGDAEKAIKQAEQEYMSGTLPGVTTDYFSDLTQEMKNVMFAKVYDYWKGKSWFEMMSTAEALTNALRGDSIPRKPGTGTAFFPNGGSAWDRLQRVFGDEPEILKAIDKKKPIEDIVEGIFHETGRDPMPMDQATVKYLQSLSDIPRETQAGQIVRVDIRNLQMGLPSMTGKPWTPESIADLRNAAEKLYAKDKLDLDTALAEGGITQEEYDLKLAIAKQNLNPSPPVTHYEQPIKKAIKQVPLWPEPAVNSIIRVLKEIGWSPVDIGGFIKAMKSSVDMSYWRQIMPLIPGHPTRWAMSNVDAWKALFSQKSAEASWYRITHSPLYAIYDAIQKPGKDFLRPLDMPKGTEQWKGVEEFGYLTKERMIPRLTSQIPTIKWSNRAFVTGCNSMLWGVFEDFYKAQIRIAEKYAGGELKLKEGKALDIEKNMSDFASMLADWSGRASLGRLAPAGPILGNILYAPRFALGRAISPRHLFSSNLYVRKQAWRDAILFVGVIGGLIMAGRQFGFWDVELNRNSADFMKIRIGNVHIDPWGGCQQFVVFLSRMFDLSTEPITGKEAMGKSSVTGQEYPLEFNSLWQNLLETKYGPGMSLVNEYLSGKTFGGDKVDVTDAKQWIDRLAPMSIGDLTDALTEGGFNTSISFALSFAGFGVQNYTGDWKENFKKLGLPKYTDNLDYGLIQPFYDTKDFWSDTASQFKGVDPETLTEKKGFPPVIKSIAEARQTLDMLQDIPNVKLSSINADPLKGDTFIEYYSQWQERLKLGDDKEKLAEFDKKYPDSQLGNITHRQFALLAQYNSLPETEREQFIIDNPELSVNPRVEWLASHPEENANLALWGQATIYTKEAYDKMVSLIKQYDIPDSAVIVPSLPNVKIPDKTLPPKEIIDALFDYQKIVYDTGANSLEAQQFLLEHEDFSDYIGKILPETPIEAIVLKIKNKTLSPESPEYIDNERRIEALVHYGKEYQDAWVERGNLVDKLGANSSEAHVWLLDHPEVHQWAVANELLTDDGSDWNVPVLRINSQWRTQDEEYDALPVEGTARADYLASNEEYRKDRRRRDALTLTGPGGEKFPDSQVENYVTYNELPAKGKRRDRFLIDNPEFANAMHEIAGIDLPDKVPSAQYDDIYEQYQEQFDRLEGLSDNKSPYYIEDKEIRDKAREELRFTPDGKLTDFGKNEIRRDAYGNYVPDIYVERYVDYYSLTAEGIPDTWAKDTRGNNLSWYEDDWYLIEHPDFYQNIYVKHTQHEERDFTKVPSRAVFDKYAKYVLLPLGAAREDYRDKNRDLDDWLLLTGKVTVPIDEKKRSENLTPAEEIAELEEKLKGH